MNAPLTMDSRMECPTHGLQKPSFICKHLQHGVAIGFHTPDEPLSKEEPFEMAWCSDCEAIRAKEGEWNDCSESFAGVMVICEACFNKIRTRNS
jgi:hypothetical protein